MTAGRMLGAVAGMLLVAGCVRLPEPEPAPDRYLLEPAEVAAAEQAEAPLPAVAVATPRVAPALGGDAIAVVRDGRRLDHFAGARWAAPLPELLRGFWRESLERRYGLTDWEGGGAPFRLDFVVRDLQAEYREGEAPPRLRVTVAAALRQRGTGELVAQSRWTGSARAEADRMAAITAGLEGLLQQASGVLLDELLVREGAPGN